MGIEPTAQAWEAWVLPLYDARRIWIIAQELYLDVKLAGGLPAYVALACTQDFISGD